MITATAGAKVVTTTHRNHCKSNYSLANTFLGSWIAPLWTGSRIESKSILIHTNLQPLFFVQKLYVMPYPPATSKYSTNYNQLPLTNQAINQQLVLSTARVLISKQRLNLIRETIKKRLKKKWVEQQQRKHYETLKKQQRRKKRQDNSE